MLLLRRRQRCDRTLRHRRSILRRCCRRLYRCRFFCIRRRGLYCRSFLRCCQRRRCYFCFLRWGRSGSICLFRLRGDRLRYGRRFQRRRTADDRRLNGRRLNGRGSRSRARRRGKMDSQRTEFLLGNDLPSAQLSELCFVFLLFLISCNQQDGENHSADQQNGRKQHQSPPLYQVYVYIL